MTDKIIVIPTIAATDQFRSELYHRMNIVIQITVNGIYMCKLYLSTQGTRTFRDDNRESLFVRARDNKVPLFGRMSSSLSKLSSASALLEMLPFSSFFKNKPKNPAEGVQLLIECMRKFDSDEARVREKSIHNCTRYLSHLKTYLLADTHSKSQPEYHVIQ